VRLRLVLASATVALAAAGPAQAAVTARIAVKPAPTAPGSPTAFAVSLKTGAEKAPTALYLKLLSPSGAAVRVKLRRISPVLWKATFVFVSKGQWRLRVVAGAGGSPRPGTVLGTSRLTVR
jgi:hypothetical protein